MTLAAAPERGAINPRAGDGLATLARSRSSAAARTVALVVDPGAFRTIHSEIATRLRRDAGITATVLRGDAAAGLPSAVNLLLDLERMVAERSTVHLSVRSDPAALRPFAGAADPVDLTIDFTGATTVADGRTLHVLYDGEPGEAVLFGALLAGRQPVIELVDAGTGMVVARGAAAADNAGTILGAMECTLARVADLVVSTARGWQSLAAERPLAPRAAGARAVLAFEARTLAHSAVRALYRLCCRAPHWRTCWRFVDGPDLYDTRILAGASWNVLPDPGFRFYADPFPFTHRGKSYVFVEDLDHRTNKGVISVIPFGTNGPSGPAETVLEEPWHLSYPFMFEAEGEVWMIPESSANRSINLYRATRFPYGWAHEATLIAGIAASDATIVGHNGQLWMFAATRSGAGSWSDTLSIFHAPHFLGPWTPHRGDPVLIDQSAARPAGSFVKRNGRLWRPVQDCAAGYGTGVGFAEVLRLDEDGYEQRLDGVLRAPADWPGRRFHTVNRAGRIECVDGAAHSPRSRFLAQKLEGWSGRREEVAAHP